MEILEKKHGAVTVLKPQGALIRSDADQLRVCLDDARARSLGRIVIDASKVPYVDSAGLEMLVDASEALADSGHTLKLCGLNETIREVLDLTELSMLFDHYEDLNDAVRSYL